MYKRKKEIKQLNIKIPNSYQKGDEVMFHSGRLPLRLSSIEVVFH